MIKKLLTMLILTASAVLLPGPALTADGFSYSGSSTIGQGILQEGAVKAFEEKTKIKFASVEIPGSGKGIQALLDGKVSIAGASRPLKAEEKKEKLLGHTIGYDAIAVFVNNTNPVRNLTKDQLKGIFTGKIKNWKEVGGRDVLIRPNTEILGAKRATTEFFQEHVLDGAPYGNGFKEIDRPADQIVEVSKDENAVCGVSLGLLAVLSADAKARVRPTTVNGTEPNEKNVKSGAYLISRPLLLVTKGLPTGDAKAFVDFMLSSDGQAIVSKNFVPVRK